ncbi:hypothetical protein vseg_018964 [Gypsophila vaccaria]
MEKTENKPQPLINLSLGIGDSKCLKDGIMKGDDDDDDDGVDHVVERVGCRESTVVRLTEEQLKELELQLIIFKYLVFGLPVPHTFLLPLWRTSSPLRIGSCSRGTFLRDMMDPEPGRCRRTDGKKWRCYQSVVPNEKYCEKHMHRGRKRSRKLVEDVIAHTPNVDDDVSKKNTERQSTPAFDVPAVLIKKSQPLTELSRDAVKVTGLTLTDTAAKMDLKTETQSEGRHGIIMKESTSSDPRCLEVQCRANAPPQAPQRCNRTDGRKWQCHNVAIPGHKYCALHVHRGLKKPLPTISPSATGEPKAAHHSFSASKLSVPEHAKTGMHLKTDLNISLLDPRPDIRENPINCSSSSSSSSSDASTETTISDDNAYISNKITVSARMH